MSRIIDSSPNPSNHIKTLMRIGYNMSSAVSDIIDNSITAESKNIEIYSPPGLDKPILSILDNGYGMDLNELIENMRIGCKNPSFEREKGDLGRFGSGLKTASFSQARKLTVISKKAGCDAVAAIWDIDRIEETNSWCLEIIEGDEVELLPSLRIGKNSTNGTQIIWEKLTCLPRGSHANHHHDDELAIHLAELKKYIGIHFHRFLEGRNKCEIKLNGSKIEPIDPFMTKSSGYQEGRSEKLRCKGGYIVIQTHVLPHFNRMDSRLLKGLGGAEGITQNQGLYIYREGRLINAGGWLGLTKNSQLGALARVQVDIPSALDNEWSTDVKKASLQLPARIRRELKKFLSDPIKRSRTAHSYRGKLEKANKFWKICENENNGMTTYQVDSENMNIIEIMKVSTPENRLKIMNYLRSLSEHIPINHIYQKMSENPKEIDQSSINSKLIEDILSKII